MNKQKFLNYLRRRLRVYSKEEVESAIEFYDELICDKVERERMTEEQAVASLGDKRTIVTECISTIRDKSGNYNDKSVSGRANGGISKMSAFLLGILASPFFIPICIAVFTIIFVVFVMWVALVVSFGAVAIGGVALAVGNWFFYDGIGSAVLTTGAGFIMFALGSVVCGVLAVYGWKGLRAASTRFISAIKSLKRKEA